MIRCRGRAYPPEIGLRCARGLTCRPSQTNAQGKAQTKRSEQEPIMTSSLSPPTHTDQLVCRLAEDSRLKIIGLGGIGCIVLQFLAVFLKSLGQPVRLVLIDGDR